ncbi:uncharacterized protein LOC122660237 [Telopea speciosissima]|uniref:uncharacterized protein LOC122660237 n=1 Tax=Telopea speciosissima TaxID=54955 RepID=UPI001CC72E4A|nr:uncharacterized protein LOC122660237 [Telopea speciosissima]
MEGLIPYIVNALKKQKSQNKYRCSSEISSSRSYYQPLNSKGSSEGSSHRRTRSDFQLPVAADLLGQRSSGVQLQFLPSRSLKMESSTFSPSASTETAFNSHLRR